MDIRNTDAEKMLDSLDDNSVNLVLTDPPYIISSHNTGMDKLHQTVHSSAEGHVEHSEEEWLEYIKTKNCTFSDKEKENWMRWGSTLGRKYARQGHYGEWDENFTLEKLERVLQKCYKKMAQGATLIVWFDLWKLSELKNIMEKCKFKQLRFIEWIKTNPQPINSNTNYLTNCREIALTGVKGAKPTFNSKYDKGIYEFPTMGGKHKIHPTQKNLDLFKELVEKHSQEGDLVCDPFLGAGTSARASLELGRKFVGSELDTDFHKHACEWTAKP